MTGVQTCALPICFLCLSESSPEGWLGGGVGGREGGDTRGCLTLPALQIIRGASDSHVLVTLSDRLPETLITVHIHTHTHTYTRTHTHTCTNTHICKHCYPHLNTTAETHLSYGMLCLSGHLWICLSLYPFSSFSLSFPVSLSVSLSVCLSLTLIQTHNLCFWFLGL